METNNTKRLIVGISGASGVIYGIRLLELLREAGGFEIHLVMSSFARVNIEIETDLSVKYVESLADEIHSSKNQAASISSSSFKTEGMVVAPCSMRTLSAIANSMADNLLTRAADLVLKERQKLVLMPRETPLHIGHCKLLYEVAQLGAIVSPPMPAFYNRPKTVDEIINHSVGRVLDLFDIDVGVLKRWEGQQIYKSRAEPVSVSPERHSSRLNSPGWVNETQKV